MHDLISRKAAIDAVEKNACNTQRIMDAVNNLPSAQQEIIRCKNCKYYKYGICMKIGANKSFYGFCDWAERGEQNGWLNQQTGNGESNRATQDGGT